MKKNLFIGCCLLLLMVTVTSCVKKEYVDADTTRTIPFTTDASSWKTPDGGYSWNTYLDVPEIDGYLNAHGGIFVYISFDGGATYEQLPEVYDGISYTYSHQVGGIYVNIEAYNNNIKVSNPRNSKIKVVLIDN